VPDPCIVLISAPELLEGLKHRASELPGEPLAFSEGDALIALETITKRRPNIIVLERQFAGTARGGALINRIKADPTLESVEIRVMSADSDYVRVVSRTPAPAGSPAGGAGSGAAPATATVAAPSAPLDQRGTRRAPRYRISGTIEVLVDGNVATLVDLSTIGAQVISLTVLKPNQRVRIAIAEDNGNVRFNAAVAWASFEIPPGSGPRYRAGLEFVDADAAAVDAFRARHQA
jgi:PilZ domain-containing protein